MIAHIAGGAMLLAIFACVFAFLVVAAGWKTAMISFAAVVGLVLWVFAAMALLTRQ